MTVKISPEVLFVFLATVVIIAGTVLALHHIAIPELFNYLAAGGLGGGLGVALPRGQSASVTSSTSSTTPTPGS